MLTPTPGAAAPHPAQSAYSRNKADSTAVWYTAVSAFLRKFIA